MIEIHRSAERGHFNRGWLDSKFSFSFSEYYNPARMGFSALRVINEDVILPGMGFGMHGHNDMEIVTYILDGVLEHKDSLGTGSVIYPGDVQRMSAGTGIRHSEYNPSQDATVHLLQIWLLPANKGVKPSYEQKTFESKEKRGKLCLVASPDGTKGSMTIGQDVRLYAMLLDGTERAAFSLTQGRQAYVHVARGSLAMNGMALAAGDGVQVTEATDLVLDNGKQAELLLFDLPG